MALLLDTALKSCTGKLEIFPQRCHEQFNHLCVKADTSNWESHRLGKYHPVDDITTDKRFEDMFTWQKMLVCTFIPKPVNLFLASDIIRVSRDECLAYFSSCHLDMPRSAGHRLLIRLEECNTNLFSTIPLEELHKRLIWCPFKILAQIFLVIKNLLLPNTNVQKKETFYQMKRLNSYSLCNPTYCLKTLEAQHFTVTCLCK